MPFLKKAPFSKEAEKSAIHRRYNKVSSKVNENVYRLDDHQTKHSKVSYLLDLTGEPLLTSVDCCPTPV